MVRAVSLPLHLGAKDTRDKSFEVVRLRGASLGAFWVGALACGKRWVGGSDILPQCVPNYETWYFRRVVICLGESGLVPTFQKIPLFMFQIPPLQNHL